MNEPTNIRVKDAANAVLRSLPDDVSWDEVHYQLYVRQQIETGLADSDAERILDTDGMRRRLDEQKRKILGT